MQKASLRLKPLEARLARVEGGIGPGGIEFDRREAHRDIFERARGGGVGFAVDRAVGIGVGARVGVEIGVAAQPLVHLAAEQLIDRLVDRLADDVPHRHLDAGEHAHQRNVGPLRIAAAVDVAPDRLDREGVGAQHMVLEHVLEHLDDRFGREARGIDLADALDPVVGDQLQEQEIAPAEGRRRIADDEGLQACDAHRPTPPSDNAAWPLQALIRPSRRPAVPMSR